MPGKTCKVPIREKIAYAMGDAGANIAWRAVAAFLFIVYTDVFGLSPAAAGTLMLVARLGDGVSDIAMGAIADRVRTRWGRFRPWILWSAIPLAATLSAMFTCPAGLGGTGRLVYAYATYILFTLVYTAMSIPYGALQAVISADERERTSIGSFRMTGAFAGGMLVQGLLLLLKDCFNSYTIPVYIMSAIMALVLPVAFFGTRERVKPQAAQKSDLKSDVADLFLRNPPWLVLLAVSLAYNVYNSVKQGVTVIYFTHYLSRELLAGGYMTALMLASIAGAAATSPLAGRFGKKPLFIFALVASGAVNALIWFCAPGDEFGLFALGVVSEFFAAIFPTLCFTMLGDAADYSEWRNSRRATGLVYSAASFAMKSGGGIAGVVIGAVLAAYGYDGTCAPSIASAATGIRLLMSAIPAAIAFTAAAAMAFYPLDKTKLNEIETELERRRQ